VTFVLPNLDAEKGTTKNVNTTYMGMKIANVLPVKLRLIVLDIARDNRKTTPPICVNAVRTTKIKTE
jgi:hypothetical protein